MRKNQCVLEPDLRLNAVILSTAKGRWAKDGLKTFDISTSTLFQRLVLNAVWIMLNVPPIGPSMPFWGKLVESLLTKSLYSTAIRCIAPCVAAFTGAARILLYFSGSSKLYVTVFCHHAVSNVWNNVVCAFHSSGVLFWIISSSYFSTNLFV